MKKLKIIAALIISLSYFSCTSQPQPTENCITYKSGFSICSDTIMVDIKGKMTHALKYQDKLYLLFEQQVLKYGGYGKRWLYIFANGQIEKKIDCPERMTVAYLDFYVKNDTIILKPYRNKQCYYLDKEEYTWKEKDETDDLIFEDDKYYVYSLDFGEWGGKTWFKDKKSGIEYLIESKTPLVNKIDTCYYLSGIVKINNPLDLAECKEDRKYENFRDTKKCYSGYEGIKGFEVLYSKADTFKIDTFTFILPQPSPVITSFVYQNKLFSIYIDEDSVAQIAQIENNALNNIQDIGKGFNFYKGYYSYRCKNTNGNNELLMFNSPDKQSFGLMDIVENKISIHYLINQAELAPLRFGSVRADSVFIARLNLILSKLGDLNLTEIDKKEQKWETFDITPNHKIGIGEESYPNTNNYRLDTSKSYLIEEDSLISNSVFYYATEQELVKVVSFDWIKTNLSRRNLDELTRNAFIDKFNFIEGSLSTKFGAPTPAPEKEGKYPHVSWRLPNGFTIKLYNTFKDVKYNRISLVVYKD